MVEVESRFFERHQGQCDVCHHEGVGVEVVSMPGVPASFAYCKGCYAANAHPYDIVVINTAMIGGMSQAAPWWYEVVSCTLEHLEIAQEVFDADVAESIADMDQERTGTDDDV